MCPTAPVDVLNLLYQTIEQAKKATGATDASVREAKSDFDFKHQPKRIPDPEKVTHC